MTNSTSNVGLDGNGNLRDHPAPRRRRQLDLGPDRDQPHRLPAPGRRQAARRGAHPDAERHRRRGRGLLAGVLDAGRALPRQLPELAGHRRDRHHGERQGPQLRVGHAALRHQPGRPVQRDDRHRQPTRLPGHDLPDRLPHLRRGVGPHGEPRADALVPRRRATSTPSTRTRWTRRPGPTPPNHGYFIILNVAMGGAFPDAFGGGPTAAPAPACPMVVDYVAGAAGRGGTSGHPTPPPPPGGRRTRTAPIQAESYDSQSGTSAETTTDTGGGQDIGSLANGDWALYQGVDFGSTAAHQFIARVACGAAGGVSGLVEVRLDSRTSAPDRQLRDRQHRRLAELADGPGEHQRRHRHPRRLSDLHQRPAGGLRQRQLVHLRPLTGVLTLPRGGPCGLAGRRSVTPDRRGRPRRSCRRRAVPVPSAGTVHRSAP